jgi:hypothetical protein
VLTDDALGTQRTEYKYTMRAAVRGFACEPTVERVW